MQAADWYVSPTATGSGNGSVSSPWSLYQAQFCNGCAPGDTIYFRGGTYNQANFWLRNPSPNGTPGNYTTYRNYPGEVPVFIGQKDSWNYQFGKSDHDVEYVKFHGLYLKNYRGGLSLGTWEQYGADNVILEYNVADNGTGSGVGTNRSDGVNGLQGTVLIQYNIASRNGWIDSQDTGGWTAGIATGPDYGPMTLRGNVSFHNINGNLNYNTDGGGIMIDLGGPGQDTSL